jgi:NAD(P)-dependent dehydrogenase (short-subunit alcohol dehydrogenase family)
MATSDEFLICWGTIALVAAPTGAISQVIELHRYTRRNSQPISPLLQFEMSLDHRGERTMHADENAVAGKRLAGTVALVTGASSGIGEATAKSLAAEGASVAVVARRLDRLEALADSIGDPSRVEVIESDVTDEDQARSMVDRAVSRFGRIDTLVNNAAALIRMPLVEFTEDLMQKAVDGNWWTLVRSTKAVLPHMLERGYGRIVNVGGEAWRVGVPFHTFLGGVGKGAMVGFTTCLAAEVIRDGITVNCVSPGGFEAENDGDPLREPRYLPEGWTPPEVMQALISRGGGEGTGMGRLAHPTEVAAAIAFLGSPETSYITGQHFGASGMPLA